MRNLFAPNQSRETYWLPPLGGGIRGWDDQLVFKVDRDMGLYNVELIVTNTETVDAVIRVETNVAPATIDNPFADQHFWANFTTVAVAAQTVVAGGVFKTTLTTAANTYWFRIISKGAAAVRVQLNSPITLTRWSETNWPLATLPVTYREFVGITSSTPNESLVMTPNITAASLTSSGLVATFTATLPHHLSVGQKVTISGVTPAAFNGEVTITTVTALAFTYLLDHDVSNAPGVGTITAVPSLRAQYAWFVADTVNEATPGNGIVIGPDINADLQEVSPGVGFEIPAANDRSIDFNHWYTRSLVASQGYKVLYY